MYLWGYATNNVVDESKENFSTPIEYECLLIPQLMSRTCCLNKKIFETRALPTTHVYGFSEAFTSWTERNDLVYLRRYHLNYRVATSLHMQQEPQSLEQVAFNANFERTFNKICFL